MAATVDEALSVIDDKSLAEENLIDELEELEIPASIREARLAELKQSADSYQLLKEKNHGVYSELLEEKAFLDLTISEELCIVHFYHVDFRRCAIMDTHLESLAAKHFETKFAKINVDKAKFFVEKLKIRVLPAIICFLSGVVIDRIVGFEELGNSDDFPTDILERRLLKSGVIKGNKPEETSKRSIFGRSSNKATHSDSEDDDDD